MKRLIVCCDGTWNSLQRPSQVSHSNVAEIAKAILPYDPPEECDQTDATAAGVQTGVPQIVFYDDGVGTGYLTIDRFLGGTIGLGIDANILEAYRFLCMNYCPGDEIYLFGFSRGSYTIRSLGGLISRIGLMRQDKLNQLWKAYKLYRQPKPNPKQQPQEHQAFEDTIKAFRQEHSMPYEVKIKLLACWDTVGSLGIPRIPPLMPLKWVLETIFNLKHSFHDTNLSPIIENAIHAIALNEDRRVFDLTPMNLPSNSPTQLEQCWFIGNHGCCGGGTRQLSAINFVWVTETMKAMGLPLKLNPDVIEANRQQQYPLHPYQTSTTKLINFLFWIFNWPPFMPHRRKNPPQAKIHPTVMDRLSKDSTYKNPLLEQLQA
ncbi:MAG: DUF2235 domain-containing protein [Thainema sp.]